MKDTQWTWAVLFSWLFVVIFKLRVHSLYFMCFDIVMPLFLQILCHVFFSYPTMSRNSFHSGIIIWAEVIVDISILFMELCSYASMKYVELLCACMRLTAWRMGSNKNICRITHLPRTMYYDYDKHWMIIFFLPRSCSLSHSLVVFILCASVYLPFESIIPHEILTNVNKIMRCIVDLWGGSGNSTGNNYRIGNEAYKSYFSSTNTWAMCILHSSH